MEKNNSVKKTIHAALFSALTCVAAIIIHFHFPLSPNGCINLSDCIILMSGILLGPLYGSVAAGIGGLLGDFFMGHISHALGTFIVKSLTALTVYTVYNIFTHKNNSYKTLHLIVACTAAECVMVTGYLIYDTILFGMNISAALINLPANIVQGVLGTLTAVIALKIMKKVNLTNIFS